MYHPLPLCESRWHWASAQRLIRPTLIYKFDKALGTNDTKPQNWKFKDKYDDDLRALVDHFAALESNPKIFLCKPVPVVQDRWGINEATVKGEVLALVAEVAQEKGLPVIDLYTALSNMQQNFPDGVHPNAAGAEIMAKTVYAALIANK